MSDIVYAIVRCCRDWPIVYTVDGLFFGWKRCGQCGTKPQLIEIENKENENP